MDARELRIGNFLSGTIEDENGEEKRIAVVVRGIDADSTLIDGSCTYSLTSLYGKDYEYYHDLEPIPITEEWLERFGFEEHESGYFYLSFDWVTILVEKKDFSIGLTGIGVKPDILAIDDDKKSVHGIQNLVHALTGQELKLK